MQFIYNPQTRSFSLAGVGAAMGVATAGIGLYQAYKGMGGHKYTVAYLGKTGTKQMQKVTAESSTEAVQKVKKITGNSGSHYKGFKVPDREDELEEYYDSLGEH